MSVAEMKLEAITKIASLSEEKFLKEILEYLGKIQEEQKRRSYNLSSHFEEISRQYNETLKKLAQ
jgi:Mg2+ and Co2+ transporter CorA